MAALTNVQKIRLLVGDKDSAGDGTGDVFGLTDDEVNWAYSQIEERDGEGNVYLAAADLLEGIAAKSAQNAKAITVGSFNKTTISTADNLRSMAKALRERAYSEPAGGAAEVAWSDANEDLIIWNRYERES